MDRFNDRDVRENPQLADVARDFLRAYNGDFHVLIDARRALNANQMTVQMARTVLNCMRSDIVGQAMLRTRLPEYAKVGGPDAPDVPEMPKPIPAPKPEPKPKYVPKRPSIVYMKAKLKGRFLRKGNGVVIHRVRNGQGDNGWRRPYDLSPHTVWDLDGDGNRRCLRLTIPLMCGSDATIYANEARSSVPQIMTGLRAMRWIGTHSDLNARRCNGCERAYERTAEQRRARAEREAS